MRYIMCALSCVFCLLSQVRAEEPHYLQISVSGLNDSSDPVCPVSLVYDLSQEQMLNGAYYIADSSCGITSDAAAFRPAGLKFEMTFSLRVRVDERETQLSGTTHALNYYGNDERGGGERTSVEKALVLGRKTQVGSFGMADGREVQLFATLYDNCPPNSTDCGENAITFITSVSNHGRSFAHQTQVRKLLAERMDFLARVDADGSEGGAAELRYAASVRIQGAAMATKEPTRCRVLLQRSYQINSLRKGDNSSRSAVSYSSQNEREVVLEPGKELRLVFPPDKPSVEGFDIEDTLVIVPR